MSVLGLITTKNHNGYAYVNKWLKFFNINHVTKVPYYPKGQAIIYKTSSNKYLIDKFLKIKTWSKGSGSPLPSSNAMLRLC